MSPPSVDDQNLDANGRRGTLSGNKGMVENGVLEENYLSLDFYKDSLLSLPSLKQFLHPFEAKDRGAAIEIALKYGIRCLYSNYSRDVFTNFDMLEYMTEKYIKELDSKKFIQPWKRKPKYHQVNLSVSPTKIDPTTYYTRTGQEEKEMQQEERQELKDYLKQQREYDQTLAKRGRHDYINHFPFSDKQHDNMANILKDDHYLHQSFLDFDAVTRAKVAKKVYSEYKDGIKGIPVTNLYQALKDCCFSVPERLLWDFFPEIYGDRLKENKLGKYNNIIDMGPPDISGKELAIPYRSWIRILSRLVKRLSKAPNLLPPSSPQRKRLEREKQDEEEKLAKLEQEKEMELYGFLEAEEEERQRRRPHREQDLPLNQEEHGYYDERLKYPEDYNDLHSQILSVYDPDLNMPVDNVLQHQARRQKYLQSQGEDFLVSEVAEDYLRGNPTVSQIAPTVSSLGKRKPPLPTNNSNNGGDDRDKRLSKSHFGPSSKIKKKLKSTFGDSNFSGKKRMLLNSKNLNQTTHIMGDGFRGLNTSQAFNISPPRSKTAPYKKRMDFHYKNAQRVEKERKGAPILPKHLQNIKSKIKPDIQRIRKMYNAERAQIERDLQDALAISKLKELDPSNEDLYNERYENLRSQNLMNKSMTSSAQLSASQLRTNDDASLFDRNINDTRLSGSYSRRVADEFLQSPLNVQFKESSQPLSGSAISGITGLSRAEVDEEDTFNVERYITTGGKKINKSHLSHHNENSKEKEIDENDDDDSESEQQQKGDYRYWIGDYGPPHTQGSYRRDQEEGHTRREQKSEKKKKVTSEKEALHADLNDNLKSNDLKSSNSDDNSKLREMGGINDDKEKQVQDTKKQTVKNVKSLSSSEASSSLSSGKSKEETEEYIKNRLEQEKVKLREKVARMHLNDALADSSSDEENLDQSSDEDEQPDESETNNANQNLDIASLGENESDDDERADQSETNNTSQNITNLTGETSPSRSSYSNMVEYLAMSTDGEGETELAHDEVSKNRK